jgi:oxygen-independent coproporphyrinogen III oxidase
VAGVYLSFPFCAQKCTYCNFASGVYPRALESEYVDTLLAELAAHQWAWTPETVYLGGGTPSRMGDADFGRLMRALPGAAQRDGRERPWREATIEASPGTVTANAAGRWRECGITRVSLGVQSFVVSEAARTGRRHTPEMVAREMEILAAAGIEHVNVDLIAGLPGQTRASWRESLDHVRRLAPDHVSVYIFEIDADSRLGQEVLAAGTRYGAADVPGEDVVAELYQEAVEQLEAMGLARYEISNFARAGCESLHNLKYWTGEPYLGVGADAHSFDGMTRWCNVESLEEYLARFRAGRSPIESSEAAHPDEERFFVGLRLMAGIEPRPEEWRRFHEPIERFVRDGLLESDGRMLRLTGRGVLLSNEVFQEFV